jgi:peptide/nickel transport system substrate-binding protein
MVLLPGYGDIETSQEQARALMASLGHGAANPLKARLTTRSSRNYVDAAIWVVSQLKDIWIDAELHQVEGAEWYGTVAKREFQFALNASATAADDPDVNFYEHFGCGSQRNYSDYCDPQAQHLFDQQSQEFDPGKRRQLVWEIDKKLVTDVARIGFGFRYQFNPRWPYVKNLVPHQTAYSWGRMQDVWLDK